MSKIIHIIFAFMFIAILIASGYFPNFNVSYILVGVVAVIIFVLLNNEKVKRFSGKYGEIFGFNVEMSANKNEIFSNDDLQRLTSESIQLRIDNLETEKIDLSNLTGSLEGKNKSLRKAVKN